MGAPGVRWWLGLRTNRLEWTVQLSYLTNALDRGIRLTDPEGFEPSTAGLEIRSPIRARRRVRTRAQNGNLNNPSTPKSDHG